MKTRDELHDELVRRFDAGEMLRAALVEWVNGERDLAIAFCGDEPTTEPGSRVANARAAIQRWDDLVGLSRVSEGSPLPEDSQ